MPIEILMPALSPTMTEGNLARWLKNEGDSVAPGDVIAEIETDKATMEVESVDEGIMGKILVAEGAEEIPVNTPIAVLLEEGEDSSVLASFDVGAAAPAPAAPAIAEPAPAPAAVPIPWANRTMAQVPATATIRAILPERPRAGPPAAEPCAVTQALRIVGLHMT